MMGNLTDRYCIVGVGETEYSRASNRSTRAMAVEAIRHAMADAGLAPAEVDGMMSYQSGDSTPSNWVASDLGLRLDFFMDVVGGGSSTEALVGLAMGAIEAGMCRTVAIFRSMNGYSDFRIGGTGARAAQPVRGLDLAQVPFGMRSAGQNFAPTFMRHMYEYGTTSAQVAHVRVAHSRHASQNPKAFLKERVTVEDVLGSRWIVKPLHLLDCCLETDNATALIVAPAERARDCRPRPVYVMGVAGRVSKPRTDFHWAAGPITRVAGHYGRRGSSRRTWT
jgi:acetyl-CoA acetyltransferase